MQLKRRYDLIPNLVETVKGYATHEREAFENVTKARAMALGAQSLEEKGKAEKYAHRSFEINFRDCRGLSLNSKRTKIFLNFSTNCPIRKTKFKRREDSTTAMSAI